jgi:hypothetical protein
MSDRRFIRVGSRIIRIDSIAYVDFLDSGRAMILMRGLTQEKQGIAVDPEEAVRLRAVLESELGPEPEVAPGVPRFAENRRWS